jgi:phosphoribosylformylglycinamidine synthase
MPNGLGFDITSDEDIRKDAFLFGESQSRIIVSVSEENLDSFLNILDNSDVDFTNLGQVTHGDLVIDSEMYGNIKEYRQLYETAIEMEMAL